MAWQVGHPIKRDGTSQRQRYPEILRPESVRVDDRKEEDLWFFLYQLSDQFVFYNAQNLPDGDWTSFFEPLKQGGELVTRESIQAFIKDANQRNDNSVFLSLINAFLKMFRYLQADINTLTKKHLDFYFETVLGFRRLPAKPDEVHVIFELAPQLKNFRIPTGTELNGGKDASGKLRTYITKKEIVVNRAKVEALKTILVNSKGIYAAEVANSADGLGASIKGEISDWPTFGHPDYMQRSTIGFAIASPLLLLKEGQRAITLIFTFTSIPSTMTESHWRRLDVYGSGEKDWEKLTVRTATISGNTLTLTIEVNPGQPAIVQYNEQSLKAGLNTIFPVVRVMLNRNRPDYNLFKSLELTTYTISVDVVANTGQPGVRELVIQNDQGLLDANQTFLPFGPTPEVGANFYIGSEEVFSKPLINLNLNFQWSGLPNESLSDYYSLYNSDTNPFTFNDITARTAFLVNNIFTPGRDITLLNTENSLYSLPGSVPLGNIPSLPIVQSLQLKEGAKSGVKQGFLRLTLNGNFGYKAYLKAFAIASKNREISTPFPNPPYTPALQSISLGYVTASQTIDIKTNPAFFQYFHIEPFGAPLQLKIGKTNLFPALPDAALYIGVKDLNPPQNLHMLFQVSESAPEAQDIIRNEDITWEYLTRTGWTPFIGGEIFSDNTLGLQKAGIIGFDVPDAAATETDDMPKGNHWLRAKLLNQKDPEAAARMIAIHAQAIQAVFQDRENDPGHLVHPLPAENIKALTKRLAAIKKVSQPYASFGGYPSENDEAFFTRISERLRHKQRAITFWDIERLVLQAFTDIYKVKTIPHTGLDKDDFYSEFRPGQLTVVVIPQLRNRNNVSTLEPKASVALMEGIRSYLLPYCTYFLKRAGANVLHVIPPRYEHIQLSFSVGFYEGFDSGFYSAVLNEDLRRHLSPWAFKEGEDIAFGGKIYKSQLLAFVEDRDYVDYVTDFKMHHLNAGPGIEEMSVEIDLLVRGNPPGDDVDIAKASTAASILVSASQHIIDILQPDEYPCVAPTEICSEGIGCWYIELDLIVT